MNQNIQAFDYTFNALTLQKQMVFVFVGLLVMAVSFLCQKILHSKGKDASLWIVATIVVITVTLTCGYAKFVLRNELMYSFFLIVGIGPGTLATLALLPEHLRTWKVLTGVLVILANFALNLNIFLIPGREMLPKIVFLGLLLFPINLVLYFFTKNHRPVVPVSCIDQLKWVTSSFLIITIGSIIILMLARANILKYDFIG